MFRHLCAIFRWRPLSLWVNESQKLLCHRDVPLYCKCWCAPDVVVSCVTLSSRAHTRAQLDKVVPYATHKSGTLKQKDLHSVCCCLSKDLNHWTSNSHFEGPSFVFHRSSSPSTSVVFFKLLKEIKVTLHLSLLMLVVGWSDIQSFCVARFYQFSASLSFTLSSSSSSHTLTCSIIGQQINPLTPNGHYSRRTAPLTSRCCILNIYSTNIRTEYCKHAA
jgi:hypothetical protein